MVVLEAAASGLPTIGTAAGYIADWAPDAALAVPAGDDEALAQGILTLLGDPHRLEGIAREARRRVSEYDVVTTARTFEQLYERTIGR